MKVRRHYPFRSEPCWIITGDPLPPPDRDCMSVEDKAAPDLSDDWFGVMPSRSVPAQVREAS